MKRTAPTAILLASGLIAGCTTVSDKKELDYQSVNRPQSTKLLEIPPDLTAPRIQDKYAIPSIALSSSSPSATSAPLSPNGVKADNPMKLERAGNERWLVVSHQTPDQLWPMLKAFWQDNGFVIKTEEPDVGIMETDWAENRAKLPPDMLRKLLEKVGLGGVYSTAQRDKFRIRLEKNAQGTEVYFSHRGMEEVYVNPGKTETRWQPRPTDTGLEAELLTRFMIRLGMAETQARESVKKTLEQTNVQANPISQGTLNINDTFERTWRRVGLALDRIGFTVNDRNRSKGIYYIKPAKNEADSSDKASGFWSSLAFWKHRDTTNTMASLDSDIMVEIKETAPGITMVRLIDQQGKLLQNELSRTVLNRLASGLQ